MITLLLPGCFAFSSFQSAAIVPPGSLSTSLAVTRNGQLESPDDDTSDFQWTNYEFRARQGTSNQDFDLGMRAVVSHLEDDVEFQWALDGRFALVPRRLTFQLPGSIWLGDGALSSFQLEPTLVASAPVTKGLELNASGSYRIQPDSGYTSYAGTLGLAIATPFERIKIRPEIAWLGGVGSSEKSSYRQFGLALELAGKSDTTKTQGTDEPWW